MTKKYLILFGVVFLVGLILGGLGMSKIMDRSKQTAVEAATQASREQCASIQKERDTLATGAKMAELRLRLGLAAIQAGKLNYGNARTEAEGFFEAAAALEGVVKGTPDERELAMMLSRKEQVLGDLAVGSPTAAVALEQMYTASLDGSKGR
ncbi:MAG: hypothetical protein ACSLFQ_18510 [Thermoanaerobaculia bacterium]